MAANLAGFAFMPYYSQMLRILETDPELKKTATGIFKQTVYAACGTIAGGALGGPPGALIGGIVGGVYGYMYADDYSSMITVVRDMTDDNKQELTRRVQELVGSTSIEALTSFIGTAVQRELLVNLVREFAKGVTKGG